MKNGPVWIWPCIYRSYGPMIEVRVHNDDAFGGDANDEPVNDVDLYFWPGQTFRFALRLIWLCWRTLLFRLRRKCQELYRG